MQISGVSKMSHYTFVIFMLHSEEFNPKEYRQINCFKGNVSAKLDGPGSDINIKNK